MGKPKVSVVRYLNTVPLIWGLMHGEQQGKYELGFTTPAHCADSVRAREADLGIIPSIEYQRMDEVEIIPGLSIASKGRVKSVLLFSNRPLEEIRTVAMDVSSRTSVALVTIVLQKFYGREFHSSTSAPEPEKMLNHADAALVIGDPALTYQARVAYVYDLAAEWKKFTGLPFVFAFWAGHDRGRLSAWQRDFEDSCSYGLTHTDAIAAAYAPSCNLTPQEVKSYLTENIDYSLDPENLKGLEHFYELSYELGLIRRRKELRFAGAMSRGVSI
jgi:chorismate dehydratase